MFEYYNNFLNNEDLNMITSYLNSIDDFKNNPKSSNEKMAGRLQKWYQKDMKYFCPLWKDRYSWWESFEYNDTLNYIQKIVQNKLNKESYTCIINSCLINKYRNGNDYIAPHSDTKLSFGSEPVICILSIGESRTLRFRKIEQNNRNISITKKHKDNIVHNYVMENNSLFIMSGDSQLNYSHEILKDDTINPRYSLTFREFIL